MKQHWLKYSGVFLIVVLCGLFASQPRSKPRAYPRHIYVTSNDRFRIRVQMFPEQGIGFILGAYYVFQSSAMESDNWVDIMTYKQDDPDPIHCDRIRFVSDTVAYVFMPRVLAVTTSSGTSWHVWDKDKELASWRDRHPWISDVSIAEDGRGTMTLTIHGDRKAELRTTDYGYHWQEN